MRRNTERCLGDANIDELESGNRLGQLNPPPLIMGRLRAERFCSGALEVEVIQNGSITKWLKRLGKSPDAIEESE